MLSKAKGVAPLEYAAPAVTATQLPTHPPTHAPARSLAPRSPQESNNSLMDVVLCDGAPNVGGAWSSEAYTQAWLVLEALRMACDTLAPRGAFVTKVFRWGGVGSSDGGGGGCVLHNQ